MARMSPYGTFLGHLLIVLIFFLNALGVVDQQRPAEEMAQFGIPPGLIPLAMIAGRVTQMLGRLAILTGVLPRLGALALIAFLIPAMVIAHHFWDRTGAQQQIQLANFLKNVAMIGGLLLIASGA